MSVLETMVRLRKEYPAWDENDPKPLSHLQLGELLNRVAWAHRSEGWGLHKKTHGHRCMTPAGTEVSCDLLVHGPTQQVYDMLIDADGKAEPTFGHVGTINTMDNFVTPTGSVEGPSVPVPLPAPSNEVVENQKLIIRSLSVIFDSLAQLEEQVRRLEPAEVRFPNYSGRVLGWPTTLRPSEPSGKE
jgi:hypothetical protein